MRTGTAKAGTTSAGTTSAGATSAARTRPIARPAFSRLAAPRLVSWAEVDAALRRLGHLSRRLEQAEAALTERIERLREQGRRRLAGLSAEQARLEREVEEFAAANRHAMPGRSMVLTHGRVGFRAATRLLVPEPEETLARLKRLGLEGCLRVKESVDVAALRRLPDDTLAEVGAQRERGERFFYELAREAVTAALSSGLAA